MGTSESGGEGTGGGLVAPPLLLWTAVPGSTQLT